MQAPPNDTMYKWGKSAMETHFCTGFLQWFVNLTIENKVLGERDNVEN